MSKAKCLKCNDIIESKHRHDFVRCSCNEIFLDGGDEYIRAGANDLNNILIENNSEFFAALDRDEVLQKLIEEAEEVDDMFEDQGYLDDDFDDYNLGVQAGTMDERDRIIELLQDYDFSAIWRQIEYNPDRYEGFGPDELISLIKGDQNGAA